MKNEKTLFAERLTTAMQAQGYKPEAAVLEREFNLRYLGKSVTLQGVRKWLLGLSMPSHDKIFTLAEWLKIPPEDLTFGKISKPTAYSWQHEIDHVEREIIETFLALPPQQKKIIKDVIQTYAKAYQNMDK